jgi:hypothetical protein
MTSHIPSPIGASMPDSLTTHADNLAEYLTDDVLDEERITRDGILDALASLGLTLVEDIVGDSAMTYIEELN